MKKVEKELVKIILQEKIVTAKTLAERLEVSLRTIKNYVQSINSQFPEAVISSNKGYSVNHEIAQDILNSQTSLIPQTSNERVVYLETRLINHDCSGALDIYDLCEELFVSLSTLKNSRIFLSRTR